MASGSLPDGLTLSAQGVISGTPTTAGTFGFTVAANDGHTRIGNQFVQIAVVNPVTVSTASLRAGTIGTALARTLTATGGSGGYSWSVTSGSLPDGLALGTDGVITGTPTTAGTFTFTVEAIDPDLRVGVATLSVAVAAPVTVTTSAVAVGTIGSTYSRQLTATGGSGPYTWTRTSGSLPPGLTLSATGVISGTPTTAGAFTFSVRARDGAGRIGSRSLTLTTGARPAAFGKLNPANNIGGTSRTALILSWAASPGVTRYEYCYDTSNDNVCSNWVRVGTATSVTISGLSSARPYYWQVRSRNAFGVRNANSGAWWRFTTRT